MDTFMPSSPYTKKHRRNKGISHCQTHSERECVLRSRLGGSPITVVNNALSARTLTVRTVRTNETPR
jgi:hypothetical protein